MPPMSTWTSSRSKPTLNQAKLKSPLADLHAKYRSQVDQLVVVFPDWSLDDLILTLDEALGDIEIASMRILEGHATRWSEAQSAKSKAEKRAEKKATHVISSNPNPSSQSDSSRDQRPDRRSTRGGARSDRPPRGDRGSERRVGDRERYGRGGRPRNAPSDPRVPSTETTAFGDVDKASALVNSSLDSPVLTDPDADTGVVQPTKKPSAPSSSNWAPVTKQPHQPDTLSRISPSKSGDKGLTSPQAYSHRPKNPPIQHQQPPKLGWAGPAPASSDGTSAISSITKPKSTWAQIARAEPPKKTPVAHVPVTKDNSPLRLRSRTGEFKENDFESSHLGTDIIPESSTVQSQSRGRSPASKPLSPVIPDPMRIPSPTRSLSPSRRSPSPSSNVPSPVQVNPTLSPRPRSPSPLPQPQKGVRSMSPKPALATEAVVLPAHMTIPNLGVKFGSLHLDEDVHAVVSTPTDDFTVVDQVEPIIEETTEIVKPTAPVATATQLSAPATAHVPYGYTASASTPSATEQSQQSMGIDLAAATASAANPYYQSVPGANQAAGTQGVNALYGYGMMGISAAGGDPYAMYGSMDRGVTGGYYDPSKLVAVTSADAGSTTGQISNQSSGQQQPTTSQQQQQQQLQQQQQHQHQLQQQQQHHHPAAAATYMQPSYPNPYGFGYPYFMPQQFNPQAQYHHPAAAAAHHPHHHHPQAAAAAMYSQYMNARAANSGTSSHHTQASTAMMYGASPATSGNSMATGAPASGSQSSGAQQSAQSSTAQSQTSGTSTAVPTSGKQSNTTASGYYDDRHHHHHNQHLHHATSTSNQGSSHHTSSPNAAAAYGHHQYAAAYGGAYGQWSTPAVPSGVTPTGVTGPQGKGGYYGQTTAQQTSNSSTSSQQHGQPATQQQSTSQQQQQPQPQHHHQQQSGQPGGQPGGQPQYPYARQYAGWSHGN